MTHRDFKDFSLNKELSTNGMCLSIQRVEFPNEQRSISKIPLKLSKNFELSQCSLILMRIMRQKKGCCHENENQKCIAWCSSCRPSLSYCFAAEHMQNRENNC